MSKDETQQIIEAVTKLNIDLRERFLDLRERFVDLQDFVTSKLQQMDARVNGLEVLIQDLDVPRKQVGFTEEAT